MEIFSFNSDREFEVGQEVQFGYSVDEDNDPLSWMGIQVREKDFSKKYLYHAEVIESQYIGRWADVRACMKCRITQKEG